MAKEQENQEEKVDESIENQDTVNETVTDNDANTEQESAADSTEEVDELSVLKNDIEVLKDKHLRLQAEYDNYRRRTLKEKADLIMSANQKILKDLLPVVDDLDLAMENMAKTEDVQSLREGIDLIMKKFQSFLTQQGVAEITAKGETFDVDKHEAIAKFPAPSEDMKGKIIDVTKKGYTLNGNVMRFAQVVVGE